MMKRIILICLIFSGFCACEKTMNEESTAQKLTGTWQFKEPPQRLTNNWMGRCCEDRTIFSGDEHLTFQKNGEFIIDSTRYGTWKLDSVETIMIDMTSSGGYAVGDFPQPKINLKIIELNDTLLKVDHSFYRFYPNIYILEPEK